MAGLGLDDLHQQADDLARCIELTALFAGAVGKEFDQVFVRGAQQVGELEVVIHQHEAGLAEMVEEILPLLVGDLGLPFDCVEVDVVFQHAGEGIVLILHSSDGLVEHVADVVLEVLEGRDLLSVFVLPGFMPAGADGDEKGLTIGGLVFEQLGQQFWLVAEMGVVPFYGLSLAVELV